MKFLRLWLFVLLAALLPTRGTMAACMLCPPAASQQGHEQAGAGPHHGHEMADAHAHADHGKCSLCAACCSMALLLSRSAEVPRPFDATERFPEPGVPAPDFVADGQERPPRSC